MTTNGDVSSENCTADYQKLIDYGIHAQVAIELDNIFKAEILAYKDLDERALDALKEFPIEGGVSVLKEFRESNLTHVGNKSAYLCGMMKTYRQKNKLHSSGDASGKKPGPDEAKLKAILEKTKYTLDVTVGQRKYGGPPPGMDSEQPGSGHEVFIGKIPKEIFEDELIPLFDDCGEIWDLRLMMDPLTGLNRGFCFVTLMTQEGAEKAVTKLDNYEIKPGKRLKCNISIANVRIFVGNIPKTMSKEQIKEEFSSHSPNLVDVIIYSSPDDPKKKNRGFAFLEYKTHKDASTAKRSLGNGRIKVHNSEVIVDWADPLEEPDETTMAKVKVLYVRNLKAEVTDEQLKEKFEPYGTIDRVKKIKDYGFVHFSDRDACIKAMEELGDTLELAGVKVDISLAKPPSETRQKQKQKRQDRQRMQMMPRGYDDFAWYDYTMSPGRNRGRGRQGFYQREYYDDPYEYASGGYGFEYDQGYFDQLEYGNYNRNRGYRGGFTYSPIDNYGPSYRGGPGRPRGRSSGQRNQRR